MFLSCLWLNVSAFWIIKANYGRRFNGMPTVSGNLWVDEEEDEDDSDDSDDSDDWNDLDDEDDEKGTCGRSGLVKRRRCLLCPNLK